MTNAEITTRECPCCRRDVRLVLGCRGNEAPVGIDAAVRDRSLHPLSLCLWPDPARTQPMWLVCFWCDCALNVAANGALTIPPPEVEIPACVDLVRSAYTIERAGRREEAARVARR